MKKLLFASTALIASAGIAAADVSVSGDGRMGVVWANNGVVGSGLPVTQDQSQPGNPNWAFTNRIRISFSASGETDSGLTFGGSIRADNAPAGAAGTQGNVYVDGAFGKLSMGNVDSGDKAIIGQLHSVGLTGLGFMNELGYEADGGNMNGLPGANVTAPARVLYEYDMQGFSFAASHSQTGSNKSAAIGAGYEMAGFNVGIGYGERRNSAGPGWRARDITATGGYDFGDFSVKAIAQDKRYTSAGAQLERQRSYGVSGSGTFDLVGVSAYVLRTNSNFANNTTTNAGIGASYDLGGGASLQGGLSRQQMFAYDGAGTVNTQTVADFGVSLSF